MRIVLTGASGFIGRHLARSLPGHEIVAAVRRPGTAPEGCEERVAGDLADADWRPVVAGADAVIHLAARVHVMRETADDPAAEFRIANVDGTRRLAEAAADAGVGRFLFMSSIKAWGESSEGGLPGRTPDAPDDPYGRSKLEAEAAARATLEPAGVGFAALRPALVYGPGVGGNLLRLMRAIDRGIPLPFGRVRNRRSMVSVRNLAAMIDALLALPELPPTPVYCADRAALSTPAVVRALAAGMARRPRLVPFPVAALRVAGTVTGRRAEIDRLVGSLEVPAPGDWYREVETAEQGLRATGLAFRGAP